MYTYIIFTSQEHKIIIITRHFELYTKHISCVEVNALTPSVHIFKYQAGGRLLAVYNAVYKLMIC